MVERPQDGVAAHGVAMGERPLEFADPHGDAGEFGGVGVELDAQHVGGPGFDDKLAVQAQRFGVEVGAVFDVLERFQGKVEKVAAAAGGVEHTVGPEPLDEGSEIVLGFLECGLRAFAALDVARHPLGNAGFNLVPFGKQRHFDDGPHELEDGGGVGVMRAELAAHVGIEAAFEQGTQNRRLDVVPAHARGVEQLHHVFGS